MRNVAHLFAPLHRELIALLRRLSAEVWERQTIAPAWRVRDVAAHLLDGDLRKLSAHRDGHLLSSDPPADVLALINALNASGVDYLHRVSPRLLADLLDVTGRWVAEFIESLDPHGVALFPVAWAGESESRVWMDTGREYTERWHHQMQIRDAAGEPLLLEDEWYEPLLWFSLRALPRAYAPIAAPDGTAVNVHVGTLAWSVVRTRDAWTLRDEATPHPATAIHLDRDTAWRVLYNAGGSARAIEGDRALAEPLFRARSVMV